MELNVQWIVGFVDGEGCFHIGIAKNEKLSLKFQVLLEFTITQHRRDVKVLENIKSFFKCGVVRISHGDIMSYRVRRVSDLVNTIIPFFEKHSLKTTKNINFIKFKRALNLINSGAHLTLEGFHQIKKIKEEKLKI